MSKPLTRKIKDHRGNEHEVYKWYWMKGWEFYQTEPSDEFGVTFGYMTNCPFPEWGSQHAVSYTHLTLPTKRIV